MCNRLLLCIAAVFLMALASCGFDAGYTILISQNGGETSIRTVRFNDAGERDPALGGTVDVTTYTQGAQTMVEISVADAAPMYGAALELNYDPAVLTPRSTEFCGLISSPIELAVTSKPGVVALGQADPQGQARRTGLFARVVFDNKPFAPVRSPSVTFGDPVNYAYAPPQLTTGRSGFEVVKSTAEDADPATYRIYSTFAQGDGDDNGETNIGDITPIVAQGNLGVVVSDSNYGPASTDYDRNGEVNNADLVPIALHYEVGVSGIEILLGDSETLGDADSFKQFAFADGTKSSRSGTPFTSTDWAQVWRTWDGEVTLSDMEAADTNADGTVYISARLTDTPTPGAAFTGVPLTYDAGPGDVTSVTLDFPGSDTWPKDGDGNYIVLLTELSVDDQEGNAEDFATESIPLAATVDTTKESGIDGTDLVVWALTEGGGLAAVNSTTDKGKLTFMNRGKITVEANAPGDFSIKDSLSFVLLSIEDLSLELEGGGTGPETVSSGTTVQFVATGTFDWDGIANGNEVEEDLTPYCNWAQIADPGNGGTFALLPIIGALDTDGASSGDSTQVSCEFPTTDDVTLYDNQKRVSNLIQINVS